MTHNQTQKASLVCARKRNAGWLRSFLRSSRQEQGQSLLEFALCLPVMLLIVTGLTSFGIAINQYLMLTDSTNSGARQLSVSRGQTTDPCSLANQMVTGGSPLLTPANIRYTLVLNGVTYTGAGNSFSCSSGSPSTGAAANLAQGSTEKLTVTYPCVIQVYGRNIMPSCSLVAQDSEYVE